MKCLFRTLAAALAAGALTSTAATAQQYPSQPIKIIVSLAPAGGLGRPRRARIMAAEAQRSRTPAMVENRTGAGGIIAPMQSRNRAPDGYTLVMGFHTTLAILPHIDPSCPTIPPRICCRSP